MNLEFDWSCVPEISGFGGAYEDACRRMVEAAVRSIRAGRSDKETDEAMTAECPDCTGAMFGYSKAHAEYIAKCGWDAYVARRMQRRRSYD